MSKSVLNAWDTAYIGPLAVCINQYFQCFIGEHVFLWLFLVSKVSHLANKECLKIIIHRRENKYVKVKED